LNSYGNYLFLKIKPHFLTKNGGGKKKMSRFYCVAYEAPFHGLCEIVWAFGSRNEFLDTIKKEFFGTIKKGLWF